MSGGYLRQTASQTAGPYLHIGMAPSVAGIHGRDTLVANVMVDERSAGERIRVEGRVIDGAGDVVRDALVEVWQANAAGRYAHPADTGPAPLDPHFRGFGRAAADLTSGLWWFETVKPGAVRGRGGRPMAPHLNLSVFARGINIHLNTRLYFADEAEANAADPVLGLVESAARRATLVAPRESGEDLPLYRFDIILQGDGETVFFDV